MNNIAVKQLWSLLVSTDGSQCAMNYNLKQWKVIEWKPSHCVYIFFYWNKICIVFKIILNYITSYFNGGSLFFILILRDLLRLCWCLCWTVLIFFYSWSYSCTTGSNYRKLELMQNKTNLFISVWKFLLIVRFYK